MNINSFKDFKLAPWSERNQSYQPDVETRLRAGHPFVCYFKDEKVAKKIQLTFATDGLSLLIMNLEKCASSQQLVNSNEDDDIDDNLIRVEYGGLVLDVDELRVSY